MASNTSRPSIVHVTKNETRLDARVCMALWGRVLLCGSVPAPDNTWESVTTPTILRGISNVRVRKIGASVSSRHVLFVSTDGEVYAYGDNGHGQCGVDTAGKVLAEPVRLAPRDFSPPLGQDERVVDAATGAAHSLLVTSAGNVYAAGSNAQGQCGLGGMSAVLPFQRVEGMAKATQVSCGRTFSLVLASSKVHAAGSTECGQLGTNEFGAVSTSASDVVYATHSTFVPLALQHIVQISCGMRHAAAVDRDGYVYTWGANRFGCLGCGTQRDQMAPVRVQQFVRKSREERIERVMAGYEATVCLDASANYWIAGRTRITGDGGLGQGYYIFKPLPVLEGLRIRTAALGEDAYYCLASDPAEGAPIVPYAWGQNASHDELGTRRVLADPHVMSAMRDLHIVDVQSGATTSYWLVEPTKAYTELPRLPRETHSSDACLVCHSAQDDDDATLLACDRCENPYHLGCLKPPLASVPEGEWFCEACGGGRPASAISAETRKRRRT